MNKKKLSLAVAVAMALPMTAQAAGFQLAEYSATGLGRAFAGEAAMADNAGAQWRNPAMLTYLDGTQVSTGLIYVDPNIDVDGYVTKGLATGGKTVATSSHDMAPSAFIPNFYLSHKLNDQWAVGLAIATNFGMETELENSFLATHFGNETSVTTIEFNPNVAYQLTPELSIGGGLRLVHGEGSVGAKTPSNVTVAPGVTIPKGLPLKYMSGDDLAFGWQLGAAWQLNQNNRIGVSYRSEVDLNLEGNAQIFNKKQMKVVHAPGSLELTLPATAEIASYHQLTDKWAMHASFNWTDWSSFEKLEADIPTMGGAVPVKNEYWEDNYRFAIGTTYQYSQALTLRSGIAYDTSAVSDANRTLSIPETDRTWLSLGLGYQATPQLTIDAAFTYIIAKDAKVSEPRAVGDDGEKEGSQLYGQFHGNVTGSIWLAGVQASYHF
ncbi:47 kDa outer membrane protein [Vibrio stylophorae]|uniref:47 kDa outer membrane protein n=1 Tax=Vibrio stylophorae TaxID=659351 RepID=A0ABM8ZUR7_9VIBR|nr:outer membrane protein transport protein [Vibrio stylophorae]CAH0534071.1 47 kDa outer membrane protein [Vibrio stylophorae]